MRLLYRGHSGHSLRSASRCRRMLKKGRVLASLQPNFGTWPATLTGKERLGRKWKDEQRIDNCNVPIDKRGTRPRPACARMFRRVDQAIKTPPG